MAKARGKRKPKPFRQRDLTVLKELRRSLSWYTEGEKKADPTLVYHGISLGMGSSDTVVRHGERWPVQDFVVSQTRIFMDSWVLPKIDELIKHYSKQRGEE